MKPLKEIREARIKAALDLWASRRGMSMERASTIAGLSPYAITNARKTHPTLFKAAKVRRAAL